jgi:membrane fusion protein (multidrug efflux system)
MLNDTINMNKRIHTLYLLFVFLSIVVYVTGCGRSESKVQSENDRSQDQAVKVSVVRIEPTLIRDIIILPGETEAWQDVRLAADKDGQIEWIGPHEGQEVTKGQLIAKIDASALKAALDHAEASFNLADKIYQRRKLLFEREVIAQEELDKSAAERAFALSNLEQVRTEYERGFVRAPLDGLVNQFYVDAGEFVGRGAPIADVVDVDKIKINVNVPELDVRYLRAGQQVMVTVDAFPDRRLPGTIDFVAYKADQATKTFDVRVEIDNLDHTIRPGMVARVAFLRRTITDALVAPLSAIVDKGGERIVFVENAGIAHSRTVTIGVIEGDRIQITSGLEAGDHLIVTGHTEVEEGMRVKTGQDEEAEEIQSTYP